MTNTTDNTNAAAEKVTWQLNALTEALGDLTLTVSDSLSVGRGSDNDVVLGSKQVSRNHAVLNVLDGQLYVTDLASSNGTFINEQRLEGNTSTSLQADDTIGFASFSFQVKAPTSAATPMNDSLQSAPVMTGDTPATTSTDNGVMAEEPVVKETGIEDMLPATADSVDAVPVESASEPLVESESEATTDINTSNQAVVEEAVVQKPVIEESTIDEPAINEQAVNESVVKQTGIEELLPSTGNVEPVTTDSVVGSAPVTNTTMADEVANQESVTEETFAQESIIQDSVIEEPVVKETGIDEVLSATDTVESTPVAATPAASVHNEPLVEQPVVHEEPIVREAPVVREEPATKPEHDKTTKTALQEEADPDVLRAKQAATAQFSGTANLGQPRDLGTEGNNAMDQAINNPANAGHIEKKPSGGWFIWVFIAILIIGLALWLFNMGGV